MSSVQRSGGLKFIKSCPDFLYTRRLCQFIFHKVLPTPFHLAENRTGGNVVLHFLLQLQIIRVVILHVLTDPQNHAAQHDQPIRNDVCDSHIDRLQRIVFEQILKYHDSDTARETARHEGEAQEQHRARLPRDPVPTIREGVCRQSGFLDAVDHQHPEGRADKRDPVNEIDVHGRSVQWGFGEDTGVDEEEEA